MFVNSHSAKASIAFAFLFFLFGLNISHASAATYYVSPSGSNTAPYDTWAKAANLPSTAITAGNSVTGPHTLYIAPGTYNDALVLTNVNWTSGTIIGTSVHGTTQSAAKGQVILSKATSHGLYFTQSDITVKNLSFTGTDATHDSIFMAGANFTGENLYAYSSGYYLIWADTGATNFNVSGSKFMGSHVGNALIHFGGDSSGTFSHNLVSNDLNTMKTAIGVRHGTSGNINYYGNTFLGTGSSTFSNTGSGTSNLTNNIIYSSLQKDKYAVERSLGTVNLTNNYIGTNWYSLHRMFNGAVNDTNNLKTGSPQLINNQRIGYIVFSVDDTSNYAYAEQVETELATRGLKGTYFINAQAAATLPANKAAIQEIINRGVLDVEMHGYSHSNPSLTGDIFSITKGGSTINVDRAGNQIILSPGGTISNFKSKTLTAISTELVALGATVGSLPAQLNANSLGEIMADSSGAQASSYTPQLLLDTTANTGYYKVEIKDVKSDLENNFSGLTTNIYASPYGYNSVNVQTAVTNSGYYANRTNITNAGSEYILSSINLTNLSYMDSSFLVGASDDLTQAYTETVSDAVAQSGGILFILSHSADEISIANLGIILDAIQKYPSIQITDAKTAINAIRSSPWSTADNITYTRTWTDQSDYNLQPTSPAIDAGTSVGLTSDYSGNPIYGAPDIGAYEYQPPHTMGTDYINIGAGARIYGDGKFRDVSTTSGTTADLIITPASGSFDSYTSTQTRPAWLDITKADDESAIIWEANHKKWKESSDTLGATNTLHTIGDLEANKYYNVSIDSTLALATITGADCTDGVCKSNNDGKITFTYTGGYSTHTFDVSAGDNTAPTVTNDTNPKFHTDTTEVTLSLTTDENSTCHYSTNQSDAYAAMTAFTTTGTTTHSALVNNLTPGDYTYYAICRDGVGNDTSYTLIFQIAPRESDTGTSDAKLKTDGNSEALDENKKIYFDENEGRLKGQDDNLANGTVKIYKEGRRYATVDIESDGSWSKKMSFGHDKTYTLKLKFYDQYGTLRDEKEYDVKVDTEKPKFTDPFPQTLTIQKDDKINFEATDDTGVNYYKIKVLDNQGHILRSWKKQTKSFYFIPENVLDQADTIVVRAYDKAGNYAEEEAHLNIGESQSNITNVNNNTPADNSGNESSNQQVGSTSTPNVCSYTVESGDSLWSIAKKVYGDATQYQKIIDLNKDKYTDIGSKLSIGQALTFGCQDNQTQQNTENNPNIDNANQQPQAQPKPQDQPKTFQWWNPFTW